MTARIQKVNVWLQYCFLTPPPSLHHASSVKAIKTTFSSKFFFIIVLSVPSHPISSQKVVKVTLQGFHNLLIGPLSSSPTFRLICQCKYCFTCPTTAGCHCHQISFFPLFFWSKLLQSKCDKRVHLKTLKSFLRDARKDKIVAAQFSRSSWDDN